MPGPSAAWKVDVVADAPRRRTGVRRIRRKHQRPPVAPTFAGLLVMAEAADVGRAAGQAVRDAVAVLVGDDPVVDVAVAVDRIGNRATADRALHGHVDARQLVANGLAVGVADHDRRNRHRAAVDAGAHGDDAVGQLLVVDDDGAGRARVLGHQRLGAELAGAAVDQCDVAGSEADQRAATLSRQATAVVDQLEVRGRRGVERAAPAALAGLVVAGGGAAVDRQPTVDNRAAVDPDEHLHAAVRLPSGGVRKLALLVPEPSWASACTWSPPSAAVAVVVLLEVAARLVEAVLVRQVVHDVVPVEEVRDRRFLVVGGLQR